jgi:hypothetical protein
MAEGSMASCFAIPQRAAFQRDCKAKSGFNDARLAYLICAVRVGFLVVLPPNCQKKRAGFSRKNAKNLTPTKTTPQSTDCPQKTLQKEPQLASALSL